MSGVTVYQRKVAKEKPLQNWFPETPQKHVLTRPRKFYVRGTKLGLQPSFLDRLTPQNDVLIDLNKPVCGSQQTRDSRTQSYVGASVFQEFSSVNYQQESAIDTKNSEHVRMNFLHEIDNVSVTLCNEERHSRFNFKSSPENENVHPIECSESTASMLNPRCHVTQCNEEIDSQVNFNYSPENQKLHPIESLEPTTPLTHNKRPSNGKDVNQRPHKKLKIKKKRHRPKVVVEGKPKRPAKKVIPKKEKKKPLEKKEKRSYNSKNQSSKKVEKSSKETSTPAIIVADSSLLNAANQISGVDAAAIIQSYPGGGPETAVTGVKGSDDVTATLDADLEVKPVLESDVDKSTRGPEAALTGDQGSDDVAATLESEIEVKPVLQSDVSENIGGLNVLPDLNLNMNTSSYRTYETRSVKNYSRSYTTRSSRNPCRMENVGCEKFCFPKLCKRTRMNRRQKSKVSILLCFYELNGHVPRKRRTFVQGRNMASSAICNHHDVEISKDSLIGLLHKETVPKLLEELPIGEEQVEVNERNAPESMGQFNEQAYVEMKVPGKLLDRKEQREEKYKRTSLQLPAYNKDDRRQIRKFNSVKARNHERKVTESCIQILPSTFFPGNSQRAVTPEVFSHKVVSIPAMIEEFMSLRITEIGAIIPQQGSLSFTAIIPFKKPKRRSKLMPAVAMDPETLRRWGQIKKKEDGMDEVEEEVNEERTKEDEEYGRIFKGRVGSFTSKMHVILGDRRFKQWKGSVVDSVVGVFLTQNVSDFLSSSAYMSLASKFPIKTSDQQASDDGWEARYSQESTATNNAQYFITEPAVETVELDIEDIGNPVSPQMSTEAASVTEMSTEATFVVDRESPNFHEFLEMCYSSTYARQAENLVENKEQLSGDLIIAPKEAEAGNASKKNKVKKEKVKRDWDSIRKRYAKPRSQEQTDSVDWEAVKQADVNVIAEIIKGRGQHNVIAEKIKRFLNRVLELHGSIDLEWLRYAPPNLVKEYLLDIEGLGLKSVECIRLLALHHVAFPVDVNVARLAVRLGWVPLQPLPGDLQFHLLEEYPIMDSVQIYLWPRLCTFDQRTLYELHYQMITFGKVFCTKRNPSCGNCPMRAECRHYASAVASAKLSLPSPADKNAERSLVPSIAVENYVPTQDNGIANQMISVSFLDSEEISEPRLRIQSCEPIIEVPKSPEYEQKVEEFENSEDEVTGEIISEDEEEIPTIMLNNEELRENIQYFMDKYCEDGNSSRALVPLPVDIESLPVPKLKHTRRLRTEHLVYELPDDHEVLSGLERRDPDDSVPYLLALWTAGETLGSVEQPQTRCNSQGPELCGDQTCFSCQSKTEERDNVVRGTILIPCRTAMRGRFPLNGTYFQVNEVFADFETSNNPIIVPRRSIWKLQRRTVFFGTSPTTIFKSGCSMVEIQQNFWRGFICLRGFDRKTRAPQRLGKRFHCPPSKMEKKEKEVNPKKEKTPKKTKNQDMKQSNSANRSEEAVPNSCIESVTWH